MLFSIDAYLVPVSLFKLHSERRAVHETSSLTLLVVNKMLIEDGEYKWSQGMCVCMYVHVWTWLGCVHAVLCG